MPYYAQRDLRGKHPIDTYPYLVSTDSTGSLFDGTGSQITATNVTASNAISASYSVSASYEILYEQSSSFADFAASASAAISSSFASSSLSSSVATSASYAVSTSYSDTALSASWAPGASAGTTLFTGSTYSITSSQAISASWAPGSSPGTTLFTASTYPITSSWAATSSIVLAPDGINSAPSIAFASETGSGFFRNGASQIGIAFVSSTRLAFTSVAGGGRLDISSTGAAGAIGMGVSSLSPDTFITRVSTGVVAVRNSTNACGFEVYNTYTDSVNNERAVMSWSGNVLTIGNVVTGSGTSRETRVQGSLVTVWNGGTKYGQFGSSVVPGGAVLNVNGSEVSVLGATGFRISNYNAYTGTTNYERGDMFWSSNVFQVGTSTGSAGGTARDMAFMTNGENRWQLSTLGHLSASIDNIYDIGSSGGNRPRNIFAGTSLTSAGTMAAATSSVTLYRMTGSYTTDVTSPYTMSAADNGKLVVVNQTSSILLAFTSSLPQGFSCTIYQSGSGQATVITASTQTTIQNRQGHRSTAGQYAVVSVIRILGGDFVLTGDTTT